MSSDAAAIVEALNRSLGVKIDQVAHELRDTNVRLAGLDHRMTGMERKIEMVDSRTTSTERKLDELTKRTEALERGGGRGEAVVLADNPYARASGRPSGWTPPARRSIIVVGGFPRDTEREKIAAKLKEIVAPNLGAGWPGTGVEDCYAPGAFGSIGKIKFETSEGMWRFLKAFKGRRFEYEGRQLFHSIDKTPEEQELSRRVSRAAKVVRENLEQMGVLAEGASREDQAKVLAPDWDGGIIRVKRNGMIHRVLVKDPKTGLMMVGDGLAASGLTVDLASLLARINFGDE